MNATSHIYIPPEWEVQSAVWVGWPTLPEEWGDAFHLARGEIALFVHALSAFAPVHIAAGSAEAAESAETQCGSIAKIHQIPLGDIWLRDTGPIIASVNKSPGALTFRFDGWGGKFVMPGDAETSEAIAHKLKLPIYSNDFVLEGGAIDVDGAGNLITTRQCLLDGIRNPNWTEEIAEHALKKALGVSNIIWLNRGLINDHTDGHVDNLARFVEPGHVICQTASGEDDPNAALFTDIESGLRASGLKVSTVPSPGKIAHAGTIAPASHLNFLMTNGAVFVPIFEPEFSSHAIAAFENILPDREIIPLSAKNILSGGGAFHCMTREVPHAAALEAVR